MGLYTETETKNMALLAPLVDEALEELSEGGALFQVEEVFARLRVHFEAKGKSAYTYLGLHPWQALIRGRLSKHHFDLVRQGSEVGWKWQP